MAVSNDWLDIAEQHEPGLRWQSINYKAYRIREERRLQDRIAYRERLIRGAIPLTSPDTHNDGFVPLPEIHRVLPSLPIDQGPPRTHKHVSPRSLRAWAKELEREGKLERKVVGYGRHGRKTMIRLKETSP